MSPTAPNSPTTPTPTPTQQEPVEDQEQLMPYEAARDELAHIVHQLETGSASLDQSLQLWERGQTLAGICQTHLDTALQRVEQATTPPSPTSSSAAATEN